MQALRSQGSAGNPLAGIIDEIKSKPYAAGLAVLSVAWIAVASPYYQRIGTTAVTTAIASLGLLVLVGWGREVSLCQAGLIGTSAYLCGYFYRPSNSASTAKMLGTAGLPGLGLPFLVSAFLAIAIVTALSMLVALVAVKLSGVYVMILTLGLQFLIENTVFANSKMTGGIAAVFIPRPALGPIGLQSDKSYYLFSVALLLLAMLGLYRFRNSKFGRSMIAVGWDRQAAAAAGVSPYRYKLLAFGVSGAFAGLAGIIVPSLLRSPPGNLDYLSFKSLFFLAIPILAGFESLWTIVAVSFVFEFLPKALEAAHISPNILGGLGIALGTAIGSRGVGGFVIDFNANRKAKKAAANRPAPPPGRRPTPSSSSSRQKELVK